MEFDLSPKLAKKVYGGDGGSYHAWCPKELPMLKEGNIGAAKLALEKNGLALPHYCDSAKVAYVLQGNGVAGIVLPEKEEKVVSLKKGDAIAIPFGVVTWWYNKEDTELVVLFLGDTKTAHKVGEFTNFYLTGSNGIFTGFSSEFVGRAWDVDEKTVKALVSSQSGKGIVKVDPSIKMPEPKTEHRQGFVYNCEEAPLDVDIKGGGKVVVLNTKNLPLVAEVGTGADLVRLDPGAMCSPGFSCDSALQVTYIVSGSGRAQIVGVDGKRVLETTVKAGHLFIVPRFFAVSKICDPSGMSWFSIISTPDPIFTHLAGKTSVWKALSPGVLQAAFKVAPDVENLFRSKRMNEEIFFPPPKIDLLLQGGLREGELTELAGMSSAGKTQVCLRVASNVAMQHAGIVVYMDTGNSFSSQRIEHFLHKVSDPHFHQSRKSVVQKVMSNIMCHSVFDIFTMFDVLNKLEVNLRSQGYSKGCKIRLLIVDSISLLITPILGGGGSQGHALMISAGYLLKKLAHEHNIVALVTNHMVGGEGGNPKPALGESWKSIPHVRLLISSDRASNICSISILKHHSLASGKGAELMVTD